MTNLTIDKASLAQALGIVTRAVSSRPTLPILANVLMNDRSKVFAACNHQSGSWHFLLAGNTHLDGEMVIALPARTLTDLIIRWITETKNFCMSTETRKQP